MFAIVTRQKNCKKRLVNEKLFFKEE